ncbi:hypothetical protein, partial [Streptomyces anulatus]|uniref:hypothetical protein n=1 Tax=Streptomyces anulatus TaxID=1892 RepID=UPI00331E9B50
MRRRSLRRAGRVGRSPGGPSPLIALTSLLALVLALLVASPPSAQAAASYRVLVYSEVGRPAGGEGGCDQAHDRGQHGGDAHEQAD